MGPTLTARLTALNPEPRLPAVAGTLNPFRLSRATIWLHLRDRSSSRFVCSAPTGSTSTEYRCFSTAEPTRSSTSLRRDNGERFGKEAVRFEAKLPLHLAEDTHIIVAAAGEGLTLGPVMGPSWGKQMPVAVSNPIFVDVDGGGFHPNGDRLGVALPLDEKFRHE